MTQPNDARPRLRGAGGRDPKIVPDDSPPTEWPVFIAYRRADGRSAAQWLFRHLDGLEIAGGRQLVRLKPYLDVAAPGVGDWTSVHRDALERARALIVIVTPGLLSRIGPTDWAHMELKWWVARRKTTSPVLVDRTGEGERWTPKIVRKRWPKAQRIDLPDHLINESDQNRTVAAQSVIDRIVGGICESHERTTYEDLERLRKLVRRLRLALGVAVLATAAAVVGAALATQKAAEAARHEANFFSVLECDRASRAVEEIRDEDDPQRRQALLDFIERERREAERSVQTRPEAAAEPYIVDSGRNLPAGENLQLNPELILQLRIEDARRYAEDRCNEAKQNVDDYHTLRHQMRE